MNNKKGISLVMLVITILVMLILASVIAFITADSVTNAKLAAFATDLTSIEDTIDEYYLNNNYLPIIEGVTYSKSLVVSLISQNSDVLASEIAENGDDDAVFYRVDMSKLPIKYSTRGKEANGDATDIYLVSSKNFNLYYLKGVEISGEWYFSLTEKLTGKTKIKSSTSNDTSNITMTTTSGIKLTKNTTDWTNELTVNIQTTLKTNETIEYFVAEIAAGTSTTSPVSVNVTDILNNNETIRNAFNTSETNKVLKVNKYDTTSGSNVLIATTEIKLANLDILAPSVIETSNITYSEYTDFILATLTGVTDLGSSGIKEARVLYTKKLDDSNNEVAYYEYLPAEITAEYVKNTGKTSAFNMIRLPKDVVSYVLVFIDNAGNISTPTTYTVNY